MKKVYRILIIVGVVLAVVIPAVILGVYFGINKQVQDADVIINEITVLDVNNENLTASVDFTVETQISVNASFKVRYLIVSYDGTDMGYGQLASNVFSTKGENHTATITLIVTNATLYETFLNDFIDLESINLDLNMKVEFLESLSVIPDKIVEKEVTLAGLNGLPVSINSFDLLNATNDQLELEVNATLENPSNVELDINELFADIIYNDTLIGNITKNEFLISAGNNTLIVDAVLAGEKSLLSDFLSNYISTDELLIDLNMSVSLNSIEGEDFAINKLLTDTPIASPGDLVDISVDMISLDITPMAGGGNPTYDVETTVIINNPVDFAINITAFTGLITYDDPDGVSYSIPLVGSWDYPAANNISLDTVNFDWNASPLEAAAFGSVNDSYTYSNNDIEEGLRLYDEYTVKSSLYVNIINGIVSLQIGSFTIDVAVEIFDIYVQ